MRANATPSASTCREARSLRGPRNDLKFACAATPHPRRPAQSHQQRGQGAPIPQIQNRSNARQRQPDQASTMRTLVSAKRSPDRPLVEPRPWRRDAAAPLNLCEGGSSQAPLELGAYVTCTAHTLCHSCEHGAGLSRHWRAQPPRPWSKCLWCVLVRDALSIPMERPNKLRWRLTNSRCMVRTHSKLPHACAPAIHICVLALPCEAHRSLKSCSKLFLATSTSGRIGPA